jgi:membrane-associated phospholipid phosphatase
MNRFIVRNRSPALRTWAIVAVWTLLGAGCVPLDLPLARATHAAVVPGELRALFHRAEVFGHAYGALGIIITIYLLDVARRGKLVHAAVCFVAAGLTSDAIKLQVWRMRPRNYLESGFTGPTYLGSIWTDPQTDWTWFMDHAHQSFPSAHAAASVGFAYSLGQLYPRGRVWFYVLATLCALNRIDGGAHFASDVVWGVALGYLVAASLPSAERMEDWLGSRSRGSVGDALLSPASRVD